MARARPGIVDRYSGILEDSVGTLVAIDPDTLRVIEASRCTLELLGYSDWEVIELRADELWTADRNLVTDALHELGQGKRRRATFLAEEKRRSGRSFPVEVKAFRTWGHDPNVIIAMSHDLSERRRLERVHEQLARFAIEKNQILSSGSTETACAEITEVASAALEVDRVGIWVYENDGIRCLDSFDRRDLQHSSGQIIRREDAVAYFDALSKAHTIGVVDAHKDPRTAQLDESYLIPNGIGALLDAPVRVGARLAGVVCHEHRGDARAWSAEERLFAGAIADFVTLVLEADERQRAQAALRESEERYRAAFEHAAVGIAETDHGGNFLQTNPKLQEILGYSGEELLDLSYREVIHPEDRERIRRAFSELSAGSLASVHLEARCLRKDGLSAWIDFTAAPEVPASGEVNRFLAVAADITEARYLQMQLLHSQRMESIGQLAGGIAHDFNNLLTAILGHTELAMESIGDEGALKRDLREIERSALRASSLTRQLLTFARRQVVEPAIVELDELTAEAERLLKRVIGDDIELVTDLDSGGARVRIDPGQFEQVVVNLAVNARDAMPDGGRLRIATQLVGRVGAGQRDLEPGSYVQLSVSDTGAGMTEDVVERIFEPFFTTKPAGQGTGLGLATCYGIIGQAGGSIDVESRPGKGTTFRVLLPALEEGETDIERSTDRRAHDHGTETVLIAEDQEAVRWLAVQALQRRGYSVMAAGDGETALALAEKHEGSVDILVTDMVMPTMRGSELAAKLRKRDPSLKVLFVSGHIGPARDEESLTGRGTGFLAKPFTPTQLASRVRALLDEEPS